MTTGITGHNEPVEDDGVNYATPTIGIDEDKMIDIGWPDTGKSKYVHMNTELFEEWVAMMNGLQRFATLTIQAEKATAAGQAVPLEVTASLAMLREVLRLQ